MDTFGCVTEDTPANRKLSKTHIVHSNVTQWSAWTNTGLVFNFHHNSPNTPPAPVAPLSLKIDGQTSTPVVIPPSPNGSQFAKTNTSAARTPAHGDHTKHFFSADSDDKMNSNADMPSSSGKQGIAELLSDIPEMSENARPAERPTLVPAASVAGVFLSLLSEQTSQDETKNQEAAHVSSPDSRKKSFMGSLFSHVDEVDAHDHHPDAPVKAVDHALGAARQSSILSLFQRVDEPEEQQPVSQTRDEVFEELSILNSNEESNTAVFILDPNPPHELPSNSNFQSAEDNQKRINETGFSKPEPLVHDHHRVFLQDSVKLSHQHPHTHQDNDTHNELSKKSSKVISFKNHTEEIPVSVSNSNSRGTKDDEEGYAPSATPRPAQFSNPFSCILPSIFCGL
jgi:hypothetical protein